MGKTSDAIFALIIVSSVFLNFSVVIAADSSETSVSESGEVDEATQNETEVMYNNYGSKIRLLQLERAINLRILWANVVIDYFKEKNMSVNDSVIEELEDIVSELNLIVEEINKELNNLSDNSVKVFVDLKSDARDLIKSFRETASPYLEEDDKTELRLRFEDVRNESVDEIDDQIKQQKRLFNAERIEKLAENIKKERASLAERVRNKEITANRAIEELKNDFRELAEQQRERIREKIEDIHVETRLIRARNIAKVQERRLARSVERLKERASVLAERGLSKASNTLSRNAERIQNRVESVVEARIGNNRGQGSESVQGGNL